MNMLLRRVGRGGLTVHGFRSCFCDWCAEATAHPREVALAHALPDRVEAAYRRGDMLEKRRRLKEEWAAFCGRWASVGVPTHQARRLIPVHCALAPVLRPERVDETAAGVSRRYAPRAACSSPAQKRGAGRDQPLDGVRGRWRHT